MNELHITTTVVDGTTYEAEVVADGKTAHGLSTVSSLEAVVDGLIAAEAARRVEWIDDTKEWLRRVDEVKRAIRGEIYAVLVR